MCISIQMFPVGDSGRGKNLMTCFAQNDPRPQPPDASNPSDAPQPSFQGELDVQGLLKPWFQSQLDVERCPKLPFQGRLDVQGPSKPPFQSQLDVQGPPKTPFQAQLDVQGLQIRRSRTYLTFKVLGKRRSSVPKPSKGAQNCCSRANLTP